MPDNLDIALQYAGRGWHVFPCHHVTWQPGAGENGAVGAVCSCRLGAACGKNAGKHPRTRDGLKSATTDAATIEAWWKQWPQANIAIATGEGSGLTVVDLDGPEGIEEFRAMRGDTPEPDTLVAQTGSGLHLYYPWLGERSSAKGKVHIRGTGGYVIAPPSNHRSGRSYAWLNQDAIAPLPAWLREYAGGGRTGPGQASPGGGVALAGAGPVPAWLAQRQAGGALGDMLAARVLRSIAPAWSAHEEARLRSALAALPADNYDQWFRWGMALAALRWERSDGSDIGFDIWDAWSQSCPDKYAPAILEQKWASFGRDAESRRLANGETVSVASIYHAAREAGWDARGSMGAAREPEIAPKVNGFHPLPALVTQVSFGNPGSDAIIFPDVDKNGRPKPTCMNTRAGLRGLGLCCQYDTFHDRFFMAGKPIAEYAGELTDNGVQALRSLLHRVYGFDPGTVAAYDGAIQECLEHGFDPVQDYLDGLTWDRKPRLGRWLVDYLGAEDTRLNHAFGLLMLVAAVRRTRQPGAKFDQIVVLEGPEGKNKSTAIEILAEAAGPGNYSDSTILTLDDRGQQEAVQGVWLYEIADLTGISKAEVERVKAFASRRVDRARPAYGRSRQDRPRRCVFFASTNHDAYLKSQTGNRRFWPVRTGHIDVARLTAERDQLWAEAAALEATGMSLGLPEAFWGDAATVQDLRREFDPWEDALRHIKGKDFDSVTGPQVEERIPSRDLFEIHLRLGADKTGDLQAKRLAYVMRRLGWDGPHIMRFGDAVARGYRRLKEE